MFSKYKKAPAAKPAAEEAPADNVTQIKEAAAAAAPQIARKKVKPAKAQVTPMDKEAKKKARMSEIKLELHRSLLDNLN